MFAAAPLRSSFESGHVRARLGLRSDAALAPFGRPSRPRAEDRTLCCAPTRRIRRVPGGAFQNNAIWTAEGAPDGMAGRRPVGPASPTRSRRRRRVRCARSARRPSRRQPHDHHAKEARDSRYLALLDARRTSRPERPIPKGMGSPGATVQEHRSHRCGTPTWARPCRTQTPRAATNIDLTTTRGGKAGVHETGFNSGNSWRCAMCPYSGTPFRARDFATIGRTRICV